VTSSTVLRAIDAWEGRSEPAASPLWLRVIYTLFVALLVPIYWRTYGPANFLWFSDIALFLTLLSLWTGNRLWVSMMAVGVLPLEVFWTLDFALAGKLGLAGYMFDPALPLYLRGLSLFHLALPPIILWMLYRHGYERDAIVAQTVLAWVVLPASYFLATAEQNVNWVFGPEGSPQSWMPSGLYLVAYMAILPVVVFLPMHALLRRVFSRRHPPRG
jgi:hypothetical protein